MQNIPKIIIIIIIILLKKHEYKNTIIQIYTKYKNTKIHIYKIQTYTRINNNTKHAKIIEYKT